MALSIGVSVGDKIRIRESVLVVKAMIPPNLIVVSVDQQPDVVITERSRTQIVPGVYVFSGVGPSGGCNRLAFEAPRSIRISRMEGERADQR